MPETPRPFVILLHTLPDGSVHWDLCLDQGAALTTWQLLGDPSTLASGSISAIPARRIADHRRAYLEYQGPISGNRGQVVRIDHGCWDLLSRQTDLWRIRLQGRVLIGNYQIKAGVDSDGVWMLQPAERTSP